MNNTGTKKGSIMKLTAFWREKRRVCSMFKILRTYICWKKNIKCNIWRVAVHPSYIQDAWFLKVKYVSKIARWWLCWAETCRCKAQLTINSCADWQLYTLIIDWKTEITHTRGANVWNYCKYQNWKKCDSLYLYWYGMILPYQNTGHCVVWAFGSVTIYKTKTIKT